MAKKLFRQLITRFVPNEMYTKEGKHLNIFGKFIHDPYLWHLNKYSVSAAFSAGLFAALIPVPFQMLLAAALAIVTKANIPISVALTWVSNPFTTPALLYISYKIGTFILRIPPHEFKFELSTEWLITEFHNYGMPILLGCFLFGIIFAIVGNISVRLVWRIFTIRAWRKRVLLRKRKLAKKNKAKNNPFKHKNKPPKN